MAAALLAGGAGTASAAPIDGPLGDAVDDMSVAGPEALEMIVDAIPPKWRNPLTSVELLMGD